MIPVSNKLIESTIAALKHNNFIVHYFATPEMAKTEVLKRLKNASGIGRGGSITIENIGLIEAIKNERLPLWDYKTAEDRITSLHAEYYLTGTNAITSDGKLVNIDGAGNRVAAMCYGPKYVFVVSGVSKITLDETAALERIRTIAAPKNAIRLGRKTPCVKTLCCVDCDSPERICRKILILSKPEPERITIFLFNEIPGREAGF